MPHRRPDSSTAWRVAEAVERLGNAHRRLLQEAATRHRLSPLQVQLLGTLAGGPPPAARTGALARELGVASPTVSDAAASLVAKGLVDRAPDPADGRTVDLRLTAEGRRVAELVAAPVAAVAGVVEQLPVDDQGRLLATLLELIGSLAGAGLLAVARTCPTCRFRSRGADGDHCDLLGQPLPPTALRVDCPEHEPA